MKQPQMTFFPKNVEEIRKVILFAKSLKKRLRCAGMKHSWTDVFSDTGEILIFLLPLSVTDTISFARVGNGGMEQEIKDWGSTLNFIDVNCMFQMIHYGGNSNDNKRNIQVVNIYEDGKHAEVKVGPATTNLEMFNWSKKSGWTLPADIIEVMITYGGSNAMICHGSGLSTQTLSDLVLEMEIINANGDLKVFILLVICKK